MGFRGAAQGFRGVAPWSFEGRRHGVSRGGATSSRIFWLLKVTNVTLKVPIGSILKHFYLFLAF